MPSVARILRYPVKGLSAQQLDAAELTAGEGLPHDRRFAITHGATTFDPVAREWRPKSNFVTLLRHEKLATLESAFDPASGVLTIRRGGRPVARGVVTTPTGRLLIDQFLAAYLGGEAPGPHKLVEAPGHMLSDKAEKFVSIIGLASIADLERVTKAPVDPVRFRPNLLVDGTEPWAEFGWVGRALAVGEVRLEVAQIINRCAATHVDPATGERDLNILEALRRGFGHVSCGVYARVVRGGRIAVGEALRIE